MIKVSRKRVRNVTERYKDRNSERDKRDRKRESGRGIFGLICLFSVSLIFS